MDMNTLFVMATRCKFRFPFKGQISVEDLWDLSVKNLDTIFKALNAEAKQAKEESLLATKSAADAELEAKIEIIKYIVAVKQEETKQKATAAANKEQQRRIDEIIAAKQDEALHNMSVEELLAMRNSLD